MPLIFRITKNSTEVFSTIRSYQRSLFQAIKRGTRSQGNHFPLYECSHSTWGKHNLQFSQLQRGCFNFLFLCADVEMTNGQMHQREPKLALRPSRSFRKFSSTEGPRYSPVTLQLERWNQRDCVWPAFVLLCPQSWAAAATPLPCLALAATWSVLEEYEAAFVLWMPRTANSRA